MNGEYVYPGKLYNGDMMLGYGLVKKMEKTCPYSWSACCSIRNRINITTLII